MTSLDIENTRLKIQAELDRKKTQAQRNKLGQFATPTALASEILAYAKKILPPSEKVDFLDPAIGTGSFFSALLRKFNESLIKSATGFEIDPHYGVPAEEIWRNSSLNLTIADFTKQTPTADANLVICNPPYVRHHHLTAEEKSRLKAATLSATGIKLNGLTGLYGYFMLISHAWMIKGGVAGWLVPSEFMDVNYGRQIKDYLLKKVTLLHIHRFAPEDVQFSDALVSSAIVWFKNETPPSDHSVEFSYGGTLDRPNRAKLISVDTLRHETKWSRFPMNEARDALPLPKISDFFRIRRGLATGDNSFFILSPDEIQRHGLDLEDFDPILPSSRYIPEDIVESDANGHPVLDKKYFLLNTSIPEELIKHTKPALYRYLQKGIQDGVNQKYLCSHRPIWYKQENRPAAMFICTYMGRTISATEKPFRFIFNKSKAKITNSYLAMYPTKELESALARHPELGEAVWEELNKITLSDLVDEGRVYGGGLHKLEPKELANVPALGIHTLVAAHANDKATESY